MERDYITHGELDAIVKKDKNPPALEEISKAESMITDEQREMTQKRLKFLSSELMGILEAHRKGYSNDSWLIKRAYDNIDKLKKEINEEEINIQRFESSARYHKDLIDKVEPILRENLK